MNTYRYDEQQIRAWVRDKVTRAKTVKQICQEAVISRATLYNWMKEFPDDGTSATEAPEQKIAAEKPEKASAIKLEKTGKKMPVTDPAARYHMIVSSLKKADVEGSLTKKLVAELVKRYTITVAQACEIVGIDEANYGYKPRKPEVDDQLVYDELLRLIDEQPNRGFIELYEILQSTRPDWTRKQLKRVYRERRLYLKRKRNKKSDRQAGGAENQVTEIAPLEAKIAPLISRSKRIKKPDATWSLGFVEQELPADADGNIANAWVLFILDHEQGTPLNAQTGHGKISFEDIISFLNTAAEENGKPKKLRVFGKEPFTNREITKWVWDHKVALHNLTLGKSENQMELDKMEKMVASSVLKNGGDLEQSVENWLGAQG
ncbi:MAG: transposase [Sphingobacteriales bacterium]|nr:MAG: transposase [Sphingobacteriales bacterium]